MTATLEARAPARPAPLDRPTWWTQVLLAVGFAWGYDLLRSLHGDVRVAAIRHGRQVLRIDHAVGAGSIASLSRWVDHHDPLADALAGYYVVMHLGVVALTLLVLWLHGQRYRWYRDALLVISAVSFAVFWFYPVAPPRLLGAGYADSVRDALPFAFHAEAAAANLYAAVPSLHVAWAAWASAALWETSRRVWVRVLAVAHTAVTIVTVLATGNHYVIDVLSGLAITVVVLVAMRRIVDPRSADPTQPEAMRLGRRAGRPDSELRQA